MQSGIIVLFACQEVTNLHIKKVLSRQGMISNSYDNTLVCTFTITRL